MTAKLEKAQVSLVGDREVHVVRRFNAPRALVYRAHTEPELTKRWMLGPPGWTMPVCEMDVRAGGSYRWRWRSEEDGKEFGFFGRFVEVNAPAKIVHEETFDPGDLGPSTMQSAAPAIITSEFSEEAGITTLSVKMLFPSKEARDGAVATGMTDGMEQSYQKLDEALSRAS